MVLIHTNGCKLVGSLNGGWWRVQGLCDPLIFPIVLRLNQHSICALIDYNLTTLRNLVRVLE